MFPEAGLGTQNGNICVPGSILDAAPGHSVEGISWSHRVPRRLWLAEEGASGCCPRRQGAQARQEQEGPEALASKAASPSIVCAKGLGEALDTK